MLLAVPAAQIRCRVINSILEHLTREGVCMGLDSQAWHVRHTRRSFCFFIPALRKQAVESLQGLLDTMGWQLTCEASEFYSLPSLLLKYAVE